MHEVSTIGLDIAGARGRCYGRGCDTQARQSREDVSPVWHFSDMAFLLRDVRSQGQSGNYMLALSFSGLDPTRKWSAHRSSGNYDD